jgi:methyltransferase
MIFSLFISFVILVRIGELILSRKNEKWLLQNGAVEFGSKHYKFIVLLHFLFICSLIFENAFRMSSNYSLSLLVFYLLIIVFKVWIILSLGKFWNTKIYRIPGAPLIRKGPYVYFKHPNYLIVVAEIMVIPLVFHLYYTVLVFSILNAIILFVRIKEENRALEIG